MMMAATSSKAGQLDQWIQFETSKSINAMMQNISPAGAAKGVVIASPSRDNPDYYYHWIRDAGLTIDAVVTLYIYGNSYRRAQYFTELMNFVDFSRRNQLTPNPSGNPSDTGLGEVKFNVDGSPYLRDWGRPQNDGPALRAIALMRFAASLMSQGQEALVRQKLYSATLPANTVIKADLEYISHHWRTPSFDLWEEVRGTHFFTLVSIQRALAIGADFASAMGDGGAAGWYRSQAQQIRQELERHWDPRRGYIVETLENVGGKPSSLDAGVILAALISHRTRGEFPSPSSDRVLATAFRLQQTFQQIYDINRVRVNPIGEILGTAIGRYPEDRYTGHDTQGEGNPWFLLTAAFAELCYRARGDFGNTGSIAITPWNRPFFESIALQPIPLRDGELISSMDPRFKLLMQSLQENGDRYLRRIQYHTNAQGALAEQFNRRSGFMQGANDLTWSYVGFLTAAWVR